MTVTVPQRLWLVLGRIGGPAAAGAAGVDSDSDKLLHGQKCRCSPRRLKCGASDYDRRLGKVIMPVALAT